jgi:aromatic ring-cleaving dioxygenase
MIARFLLLSALLLVVYCHPTYYPHRTISRLKLNGTVPTPPPPIISYHVHITYSIFNPDIVQRALALRAKAKETFKDFLHPDCSGRYDNGVLCFIDDHNFNTTLEGGPFPSGEWSIFVPLGYYSLVVPWMIQNRGEFSLLVHPNSGYEYEDHSIWAMWSGAAWPLDLTIFEQGTQTNEFGHYPGDPDNPVCLFKGYACGDSVYGPSTICCNNLTCNPAEQVSPLDPTLHIYRCQ